ncbi:efflux RND transporter periplasmic adaptor subunit [Desulfofustis glycolicus]|uniref:HlyD family secretion protein n=1 Tax=Desulfofustis glycolicus DSM 9705 TaxID=1121409 RepID=A0A1M5X0F7_9BACT|nr:HlyD family efflux transporter periplasmic adaptor subunit [Desulfofustis glycolicus]MCB2218644.1 efflux RND transporter periplasmic adaptor subunit [Desulfobulbaceae bacterium]SHH93102.1 HlyD family secretion protein [Desulfofustis glycolicus DSM 9705]
MKKRIILLLLIAGLALAGYQSNLWKGRDGQQDNGTLKIYGTIDIRDASLAFTEQERLTEVLVDEGDSVAAGQVVARLNTYRLEASIAETEARIAAQKQVLARLTTGFRPQEISQAQAEVEAAQVEVTNAEQVLRRVNNTSRTGASSQQDLDDAKARFMMAQARLKVMEKKLDLLVEGSRKEDIAAAEHQLEALQANLRLLTIRFADRTLISPANGIIQSRILEPGEMAGPTRPVFTLALTNPKWVRAYLPEPQLGRVRLGMKASIAGDSWPGEPIEGWIGSIAPIAEFTPRTVQTEDLRTKLVYETRVMVPDPENRLRLGMPVTVTLETETIPSDAVSASPATNRQ